MLTMTVLDYDVLARQKRERLLAEADQLRALARVAATPKHAAPRGLLARLLGRLRMEERPIAGARVA